MSGGEVGTSVNSAAVVFSGALVILTAIYVLLTRSLAKSAEHSAEAAQQSAQAAREGIDQQRSFAKVGRSLSLITRWNDPIFASVVENAARSLSQPIAKGSDSDTSLIRLMSFLEELALTIHMDAADELLLREFFEAIVATYYPKLQPWIGKRREDVGSPKLYDEFERLAKRWLADA